MARVALVVGSSTGGMGRHVAGLVVGLVADGTTVDVYCPEATEARFSYAASGATVTPLEIPANPGLRDGATVTRLRRALRERPVDVVHAHGLRAGLVAALARPDGVPLVVTWHTTFAANGLRLTAQRAVARVVARSADLTLCASADLVAEAARLGARDARLAMVVAPALPAPARGRDEVLDELGVPLDSPLIVAVGRLHPHKRHDVLVAAAARWRSRRPAPAVIIAGTGPSYRKLAAQIALARAPVILVGHRNDVADLLNAADVAVVTSDGEGSPLFVQEVLASGVPLVATEVSGVADLAGDAAVLVPPDDVDAVDREVGALLDDPDRRADLAAAGRARAATWPTEAETVHRIATAYADLTNRADPVRG